MADITKANEKICAWQKNLEKLKTGQFGELSTEKVYTTLVAYWKAQAAANYPYASENVKYFEELAQKQEQHNSKTER